MRGEPEARALRESDAVARGEGVARLALCDVLGDALRTDEALAVDEPLPDADAPALGEAALSLAVALVDAGAPEPVGGALSAALALSESALPLGVAAPAGDAEPGGTDAEAEADAPPLGAAGAVGGPSGDASAV